MVTIGDKEHLMYYGIEPGDEKGGILSGGMIMFKKDGKVFDLASYKTSRRKEPNRFATFFLLIKIGALIDALMLVSYLGWRQFSFFAPVAEPQIKIGEGILRLVGLL